MKRFILYIASLVLADSALAQIQPSPYGHWSGQTQYQAMIGTTSDPVAHVVIDLALNIDPRGKVTGSSPENGCQLLGVASPGLAPFIVSLDVTLTNCSYARFNRVYKGQLSVLGKDAHGSFALSAIDITPPKGATFTLSATLQR
jgi:hypothetical protein